MVVVAQCYFDFVMRSRYMTSGLSNGNIVELEEKLKVVEKTKSEISFEIENDRYDSPVCNVHEYLGS